MAEGRHAVTAHDSPRGHGLRGYLFIAAATLCWAISATMGRAVFTGRLIAPEHALHPIDPLILAQTRTTLAFLVLAPFLLIKRGRAGLAMGRRELWSCLLIGVLGMAGSNYFYYLAIQRTNVATAIVLQYTAPIWVLLWMVTRRLQRATPLRVLSVVLAVAGSALAIGAASPGQFRLDTLGIVAAQLAAIAFAFYNVMGGSLLLRYDRWRVLFYSLMMAALFWLFVNPPWTILAAYYSPQQWLFLFVFAMTSVLAPFSLYFSGLQYLDATRAIVTSCLEPVFSIVIAAALLGELLDWVRAMGIVVVLLGTVLVQISEKKKEQVVVLELIE